MGLEGGKKGTIKDIFGGKEGKKRGGVEVTHIQHHQLQHIVCLNQQHNYIRN